MPALPPVPGVLRVDFNLAIGGLATALVRTHWAYVGGPPSAADCVSIANSIQAAYAAHILPHSTQQGGIESVTVVDLNTLTGAQGTSTTGFQVGAGGTGQISRGTSVLLNYHVARRYRGGKPRSYWPWGAASDINALGDWGNPSPANWLAGYTAFASAVAAVTAGTTNVGTQRNVSYFSGYTLGPAQPGGFRKKQLALRAGGPLQEPITGVTVAFKPGTQRRRVKAGA